MPRTFTILIVSALAFVLPLTALAASVAIEDLPEPIETIHTSERLQSFNCEDVTPSGDSIKIPKGKPYYVTGRDTPADQYFFCPENIRESLATAESGQVKVCVSVLGCAGEVSGSLGRFLGNRIGANITGNDTDSGIDASLSWIGNETKPVLIWFLTIVQAGLATIAITIMSFLGSFLGIMLNASRFVTHPFVRTGWPIIQGFANLGFVLALLYIALLTTLNIDGFSARRLLPRLLIAALFINFSLIVGGLLIDLSRLIMAVLIGTISDIELFADIGPYLIERSGIFSKVFELNHTDSLPFVSPTQGFGEIAEQDTLGTISYLSNLAIAVILIWGLMAGLFVAVAMLFVRYIMLLLLLIASPIAYLAFVLPQTAAIGKRWWSEFIKYLLVGPIILFVLILIPLVTSSNVSNLFGVGAIPAVISDIFNIAFTIAMLIAAATAGKKLGTVGATGIIDFATKYGKRGAYYGTGLGFGVAAGQRQVSDFLNQRRKYKEDQEKKRRRTSFGTKAGQTYYSSPEKRKQAKEDTQAQQKLKASTQTFGSSPTPQNSNGLRDSIRNTPSRVFRDDNFADNFSASELGNIFSHADQATRLELVGNVNVVKKMEDSTVRNILNQVPPPGASDEQKRQIRDVQDELHRTLRRVRNAEQSEGNNKN